jgi:xylulokinase
MVDERRVFIVSVLLGIDIGTSSVKSMIMEAEGKVLGFSQIEYAIDIPAPGYAEQDPNVWWDLVCKTSTMALEQAGLAGSDIAGIGISGQMHGLVALDEFGISLRPSIIWCDQRTVKEKERLERLFSKAQLGAMIKNPIAAGFQLLSLLWMKEHELELFSKIKHVLTPKDYIRYRLTGIIAGESTDASGTSAFDPANRIWSLALLASVGIDAALFPVTHEPWEICGSVTQSAAADSLLYPGTPVVFGGADQPMQAIGNGIINPGTASCTLGTGGQLFTPLEKPIYDPELRTHMYTHATPNRWYLLGATLNAGLSLKWLANNILRNQDYGQLDDKANQIAAGSDGLVFLPYLTGERTPHMDPLSKGMFYGLTLNHTDSHMVRAVLEGVAYSLRDCLEIFNSLNIKTDRIIVSGGGAKSMLWKQIMADILDRDIYTSEMEEQACVGAIITAAVGIGLYTSMEQACDAIVRIQDIPVRPIAIHREIYCEQYVIYRKLYDNNRDLFHSGVQKTGNEAIQL